MVIGILGLVLSLRGRLVDAYFSSPSITLFPLRKPALLKQWLRAMKKPNYIPSVHHFLCSDHFTPECFLANTVHKKSLTDNAVPTIFHLPDNTENLLTIKLEADEPPRESRSTTTMVTRRMLKKESVSPKPGGSRSDDYWSESELDKYLAGGDLIASPVVSDSEDNGYIYLREGIDNDHIYDNFNTTCKIKQQTNQGVATLIVSESDDSDSETVDDDKYVDAFTRIYTKVKKNKLRMKRTTGKSKALINELVSLKRTFKRKLNKKHVKMFINIKELVSLLKQKQLINDDTASILTGYFSEISLEIVRIATPNAKFSDVLQSFAATLHFYSPAAYDYVLNSLKVCLPQVSTLRNIYKSVNGLPGFTSEAFQAIKHRASTTNHPIYVALVFDEMSIFKKIEWDEETDCFFGAVNFGKGVEALDSDMEAREVFVIMAVAINASWRMPIAYFLINDLAPDIKTNLINESIVRLHEVGVEVKSITSVELKNNMAAYIKLGASNNKLDPDPAFEHPVTHEKVYTLFDACHMIKLIRHLLCNNKILIDYDGSPVTWQFIERLQNLEENVLLKLAKRLKKPYCAQKMKEKLAPHPQLLNATVGEALMYLANDLEHPDFEGAEGTANFCFVLDKLFDVCNSKNWLAKDFKAAMSPSNMFELLQYLEYAEHYLTNLADSDGRLLINSVKKTTILGVVWSIRGIKGLFHDLVGSGKLKYLTSYKLSEDHLELFFCMIRSQLGWVYNPPAVKFKDAYKEMLVEDKLESTENCSDQVDVPLLSLERENDLRALGVELDPCIFSTARRNGNSHFEGPSTAVVDDDYIELPLNLSYYLSNVILYLAGFVARRITPQVKCETCCDALIEQEIINGCHVDFFARENNGVFVVPSKDVVKVCNLLEREIRVRQLSVDEKYSNISALEVWRNVIDAVRDLNIFVELSNHFLDNLFPGNHLIRLVILISKMYVRLRCHYGRSSSVESMVIQ